MLQQDIELQSASIQTKFDVYEGTFFGARTKFPILDETIMKYSKKLTLMDLDTDIVNLTNNTN